MTTEAEREAYARDLRETARRLAFLEDELHSLEVEAQNDGGLTFEEAYRAQLEGRREATEALL